MRRFALMALLIIGTMSAPARGTVAYLTSAASSAGTTFEAATISLSESSPTWTSSASFGSLYPGQEIYGQVTVTNNGNASLRYSLATIAAQNASTACGSCDLAAALTLAARYNASASSTCNAAGFTANYSAFATSSASDGTAALADAGGATIYKIGDPTAGNGNSDNHLIAPGNSEYLCMKVALPAAKATDYATYGKSSVVVTFKFVAVQASGL